METFNESFQEIEKPILVNKDPFSAATRDAFILANYVIICGILSVMGITTNIVNIIVFIKMGFQETVNISLFALAVSDLCSLISLLWVGICLNPLMVQAEHLDFIPMEISHLTGGWPHVCFVRATGWVTAFVTVERFICVAYPLKVKMIFTPRRVTIIIVFLFIAVIGSVSPTYYSSRMTWRRVGNRTLLGLSFTEDRDFMESITNTINNVISPMASFGIVVVCTLALVVKLNQKAQWRKKSAAKSDDSLTSKDNKVARMMIMVSTVFIVCFTPTIIIYIVMVTEAEFSITGQYMNIFIAVVSLGFVMEGANSTINIFVYYKMSSKYKAVFTRVFVEPLRQGISRK